ncbi:MAG: hypothetical protein M1358_21240 [Chloroflexi bacterium]|nr:hypothetical protein [Chloroflexota bacterium]
MTSDASTLQSKRIRVRDSLEAVNKLFYGRGLTDGLPIVPPTEARVQDMLSGGDWPPDGVIGLVPPRWGEATVEKIAINAVMAGCLPEYLPVLVVALQAMLEAEFNLPAIQVTTHPAAPLIIVNGPAANKLDINSGYNVFGPGWRANATIGRAIRLILLNIGGGVPGRLDRATQGQPSKYSYCIAENEEASPWEPLHVERGFASEVSTVTLIGAESPHNVNDHVSTRAEGVLTTAARTMATMGANNQYLHGSEPVLVLGPEHAATIAADGWSKQDVKKYIFENARQPLAVLKKGGMWGMQDWPTIPDSAPDDTLVPIAESQEHILVIVAGGSGKHSSYLPTFGITRSVTKAITARDGTPLRFSDGVSSTRE